MGKYSIKELEQLSGIKAHTIRIWEKRHNVIQPERTQSNIRYYSDDDLRKIINISILNNNGLKISKIAHLSQRDLSEQVQELAEVRQSMDLYIDQFVVAMIDLDEERFELLLSELNLKLGMERTITEVVYPFLEKIGILWQVGGVTPAQEHFITHLIRQKLIVAIDGLPLPPKSNSRAVLFLPEHELHELSLLFHHYLTKKAGYRTYYLGQSVPHQDLVSVVEQHNAKTLITVITSQPSLKHVQHYINKLGSDFPNLTVFVSGSIIRRTDIAYPPNVHLFSNALALRDMLTSH
jgi:DNA-binding transcriptional MerR regulator